jgi:hypothetical protein
VDHGCRQGGSDGTLVPLRSWPTRGCGGLRGGRGLAGRACARRRTWRRHDGPAIPGMVAPRPRRDVCVDGAAVRPVGRLTLQTVVTGWGSARAVLGVPRPSRPSRRTVSVPPGGVPLRLSWKFRLSWKLLAAIYSCPFLRPKPYVPRYFDSGRLQMRMVFRVTAARPPLGCGHPGPVDGAWGTRTPSGPRDLREKRQLTRKRGF